mgnify:CR=1 FL=1
MRKVQVYDYTGKLVFISTLDNQKYTLNVESFQSGIYFVKFLDADNKVLKNERFQVVNQ